jgi:hypothetical protein
LTPIYQFTHQPPLRRARGASAYPVVAGAGVLGIPKHKIIRGATAGEMPGGLCFDLAAAVAQLLLRIINSASGDRYIR